MSLKLTPAQLEALSKYEGMYGRCWKSRLRNAWITGRYGFTDTDTVAALQSMRNNSAKVLESLRVEDVRTALHHHRLIKAAEYLVDRLNEGGVPGHASTAKHAVEHLVQEHPASYRGGQ